jgi:dTDP-4-amino-4,6-dideoxygalactose transaminase
MTVFSFHPVKTITCGEGGAITTNNEFLYKKLLKLRTIGITKDNTELSKNPGSWYYEMQSLGGNYRMTDIQAALGCSQLSKLAFFKKRRREIVNKYNATFADSPYMIIPYEEENADSCFHLYVLQIDFKRIGKPRGQVMDELKEKGIGTQVHYIPVNSQPYYKEKFGYKKEDFPIAERYYEKALSIPLFSAMSNEEVNHVYVSINEMVGS